MTKAKINSTKEMILKTAGSLFSQRGYFGVSMQDIADELSITKAALYYHFESKEALTEELLRGTVDELKQELKRACKTGVLPSDKVFNIVKTFLDFKIHHPELSLLVSLGFASDENTPVVQFVQDLRIELTKYIRKLIGGIDFIRRITYKSLFLLTTSLLGLMLSPFQNTNNTDIAQDFTDLFLLGVGKKGKNQIKA